MVVIKALLSLQILILDLEDMPIFYKNPEIEKSVNFFLYAWLQSLNYTHCMTTTLPTALYYRAVRLCMILWSRNGWIFSAPNGFEF